MSGNRRRQGAAAKADRDSPGNDRVGYGRPPKHSQFKPGHSGNPKGRPKGAKNEATIWRNVFNKRVAIREGGRQRKVSLLEAMILKFVENALKGNTKTAAFALNRYRLAEGDSAPADEADQDDREVFETFVRRLEADVIAKKKKE